MFKDIFELARYVNRLLDAICNIFVAITFVALGTSLPDTFASKTAAANEKNADNAIGNVTGSNSVNVFLGLGLPWVIAAIYHWAKVNLTCIQHVNSYFFKEMMTSLAATILYLLEGWLVYWKMWHIIDV